MTKHIKVPIKGWFITKYYDVEIDYLLDGRKKYTIDMGNSCSQTLMKKIQKYLEEYGEYKCG